MPSDFMTSFDRVPENKWKRALTNLGWLTTFTVIVFAILVIITN